jgi:hypothetical protein
MPLIAARSASKGSLEFDNFLSLTWNKESAQPFPC